MQSRTRVSRNLRWLRQRLTCVCACSSIFATWLCNQNHTCVHGHTLLGGKIELWNDKLNPQETTESSSCRVVQALTKIVFSPVSHTRINRGGTVRAYHLYIGMVAAGGICHSIGILIALLVAEINDLE
jgi:hypothetical protein